MLPPSPCSRMASAVSGTRSVTGRVLRFVPDVPLAAGDYEVRVSSGVRSTSAEDLALPLRYVIRLQ